MPRVLIIAYGNPLRSDDAMAWHAAAALEGKFPAEEVEITCLQQLGPELAESASRAECVIFVDAATGPGAPGEIRINPLSADETEEIPRFCHALPPAMVMSLAARLYDAHPRAISATIVGKEFDHGESLSPAVKAALPDFITRIEDLIRECGSKTRS